MHNPIPMHNGRRDMARELGQKFDALRQQAHDECRRNEGAIGALAQAETCLNAEMSRWSKRAKEGEIDRLEAENARARIDDCAGTIRNLKLAAEHNLIAQRGKFAQAEAVLDTCQAAFDQEGTAIETVLKMAVEEAAEQKVLVDNKITVPTARKTGEHPGTSVASKRKAKA